MISSFVKYFPFFFLFLSVTISNAQNSLEITLKNSTLVTTDSLQPFWFAANQHGKILSTNQILNISDVYIGQSYINNSPTSLSYTWGGNLIAAFGETNYFQLNQAFAGILLKGWELKGGLFYDPVLHAGLSTTNGNLARSQNARPYPMIRFSTRGYKSLPFFKNWLSFKAEYDEGILNDDRYIDKAHLHHKSLYTLIRPSSSWEIQLGFEHFVMWGGISPDKDVGKLPSDFKAYWRYVFAAPGDKDFIIYDQNNVAGNQLGTYQLEVVKHFSKTNVTFYLSHPYEDYSGIVWRNWPDNLLGLHVNFNHKNRVITDVVYEYTNTRQQSIRDSLYVWDEITGIWERQDYDPYYTHGIYKSGYSYHQLVMCSPLFFPVEITEVGSAIEARSLRSTRFYSHHIGLKGYFSEFIQWKGMFTWIHHFGMYQKPYEKSQKQLSGLFEIQYINPGFPVQLGLSAAADVGNTIQNNTGVQFWIKKTW